MLRWCQSTVRRALGGKVPTAISANRLFSLHNIARNPTMVNSSRNARPTRRRTSNQATYRPTILYSTNISPSLPQAVSPGHDASSSQEDAPSSIGRLHSKPAVTLPTSDEAFNTLHQFFTNRSTAPRKPSIDTLIECYSTVKLQRALAKFNGKHLTGLMSLLGTISIPLPHKRCIYFSKFASQVKVESNGKEHWELIMDVSRVKERVLGLQFNGTDRFWIMRALLAQATAQHNHAEQDSLLNQATMHYLQIWKYTPDPEVHVPYFEALFSTNSSKALSTLVSHLCRVLELHRNPHKSIQNVLWRVALERRKDLTSGQVSQILSMITSRLDTAEQDCPSATVGRKANVAVGIEALAAALGNVLFPSFSPNTSYPADIQRWARQQATSTFHPSVPEPVRMAQLYPLIISKLPKDRLNAISSLDNIKLKNALEWGTVLLLASLQHIDYGSALPSSSVKKLRGIANLLWRSWLDVEESIDRPLNVTRTIVSAFFRFASKTSNHSLTRQCTQFCMERDLFQNEDTSLSVNSLQVLDLRVAYVVACVSCEGRDVRDVLSSVNYSDSSARVELIRAVFRYYAFNDGPTAHAIHQFGREERPAVDFDTADIHTMSITLVKSGQSPDAIPYLRCPHFSDSQLEELVSCFLQVFRLERRQAIDPAIAKLLGITMVRLYADTKYAPSTRFKWPIRYFFQLLILADHPALAFKIIEAVHRQRPDFFTTRLFLRLARAFVQRRQMHYACRLTRFLPPMNTPASQDFHRKLLLLLTRAGADAQARQLFATSSGKTGKQSGRELMARAVRFSIKKPTFIHVLSLSSILKRHMGDPRSVKFAFDVLVRSHRFAAARKVLAKLHNQMDSKSKTLLGNTFLHGYLKQHVYRNGRLVRQIVRTKNILEREYGFQPDRITMNIVIKSMLRWRQVVDSQKIKELFDHMIRSGYPVSQRWQQINGVPFGTRSTSPTARLPNIKLPISFERHVRPLYKMFIKAFYQRGDVNAARLVVRILGEEEDYAITEKEARERERYRGVLRKKRGKEHVMS